jgi:two-component system sensor histidine kinase CiaH
MAIRYPKGMFRSARLKLTLFYLVILVCFSLVVTVAARVLAEREYNRSVSAQLSEVRDMFWGSRWDKLGTEITVLRPDRALSNIQNDEAEMVRQHLNRDFMVINSIALLIGGVLSYWFAGRTLRPIEQAHRAQARFASDASHELRTPLASMRIENEVFLRQASFTQDEAREQIESNLEEVQRLETLSNNLLALTHYGHSALALNSVDVAAVALEAADRARVQSDARRATLITDVKPAQIQGHHDSLVQLMGILLDNAIKYGPREGKVIVHGQRQGGQYIIRVKDQGPGIAAEDLPHVFERLYRSDKARTAQAGGYGLGLALAREIAKANQGSISAKNNKDGGACLEVRLNLDR